MRAVAAVVVGMGIAVSACGAGDDTSPMPVRAADGADCTIDDDCRSRECDHGYCAGSSCQVGGTDCEAGWTCVEMDGTLPHTDYCLQSCSHCPPTFVCSTDNYCAYDPQPLVVDAGGPYTSTLGTPTLLEGTLVSSPNGSDILRWTWNIPGVGMMDGQTLHYTFADAGTFTVLLQAIDADFGYGSDEATITITP